MAKTPVKSLIITLTTAILIIILFVYFPFRLLQVRTSNRLRLVAEQRLEEQKVLEEKQVQEIKEEQEREIVHKEETKQEIRERAAQEREIRAKRRLDHK